MAALLANDDERALAAAERSAALLRGSTTAPPAHPRAAWPLLLALYHRPEASAAVEEMERSGVAVHRAGRGTLTMARAILAGRTDPEAAVALAAEAETDLAFVPQWHKVVRRLGEKAAVADGWAALRRDRMPDAWARLGITRREAEVLALVIEGLANREIAERLYLSVRTVEKHVESLLRKTATRTRTQLARAAAST
jgi:DNA-binding CsgD family transcriptional regulator